MNLAGSGQWAVGSERLEKPISPDTLLSAADCRLPTDSGVILIALLWILTALSIIALSFSRETFVEVAAARNAQSLEDSYFVARAGISATIYQLLQRVVGRSLKQPELQEEPDPIDLGIVAGSLGGSVYRVNIQDESGKLNVNQATDEQLRALMEAAGIPKEDGDIITDSILDWIDTDSEHRLNGAEEDYYETLNPPYKPRNGQIEVPEQMLLIRGITPEYFYGRPERAADGSVIYKYGLSRYLSVYSRNRQINVNYAPLPVLLSVPGMSPDAAKAIYDRRHVKPFKQIREVNDLGMNIGAATMPFLTAGPSDTVTLTASAHAANSKVRRVIRTVVRLEFGAKKPYRTLYWNENVPDYEGMTP